MVSGLEQPSAESIKGNQILRLALSGSGMVLHATSENLPEARSSLSSHAYQLALLMSPHPLPGTMAMRMMNGTAQGKPFGTPRL